MEYYHNCWILSLVFLSLNISHCIYTQMHRQSVQLGVKNATIKQWNNVIICHLHHFSELPW